MVGINLAFARSFLCLVLFSFDGRDGLALRAVDEYACTVLVDEAYTPTDNPIFDMTLSVMRSIKNSSTNFSAALNSSEIHARG